MGYIQTFTSSSRFRLYGISFVKTMLVLHEVYGIFKRRDKVEYSNFLTMSAFPTLCTNGDMFKVIRASYSTNFPISRPHMLKKKKRRYSVLSITDLIFLLLIFITLFNPYITLSYFLNNVSAIDRFVIIISFCDKISNFIVTLRPFYSTANTNNSNRVRFRAASAPATKRQDIMQYKRNVMNEEIPEGTQSAVSHGGSAAQVRYS